MPMRLLINGDSRLIPEMTESDALDNVLSALSVRKELVAVALNDVIVPRSRWDKTSVFDGDRVEVVHFVGGGS